MPPKFEELKKFSGELTSAGVVHALGGSGLISLLGAHAEPRDWDLTTDEQESKIKALLPKYPFHKLEQREPYQSAYAYRIQVGVSSIDLIGRFSVKLNDTVYNCETIVTGEYDGVPLGSLDEWKKMYEALGKTERVHSILEIDG